MHLYYGGFGHFNYYTVAENDQEAVKQIQERNNMKHLPVTVELIDKVDGYNILPMKEEVIQEDSSQSEVKDIEEEPEVKRTARGRTGKARSRKA